MGEWLRFGLIVLILVIDDLLREVAASLIATKELMFEHLPSIVLYKARALWRSRR